MKFCSRCGKEVLDEAIICMNCGCALEEKVVETKRDVENVGLNVLSFFIPLVGLILYCCWRKETPKKANGVGKWALIGFVVSVVLGWFL